MAENLIIVTDAIASGGATKVSDLVTGLLNRIRIDILTSAGAASVDATDVRITDSNMGQDILTVTNITGLENIYNPQVPVHTILGVATGLYTPLMLTTNRLTVVVTNGTNTDYVRVLVETV